MVSINDRGADIGTAPECTQLVDSVETLIELGRRGEARAVMRLMRRCIVQSDCRHASSCSDALRRMESRHLV